MKFLSLFSGIGGIDLGLERAGMECVGQVEIDPYCRAVLEKHWPNVKRMEDVTSVQGNEFGRIDLIAGGFPCQDISCAGKGKGIHAERSGLWWEMRRIIEAVRPAWVLAENVPALRTRGADDVVASLEGLGYTGWPIVVGAWAVGAPHKRDRVWIVARHVDGSSGRHLAHSDRERIGDENQPWRRERTGGSGEADAGGSREAELAHANNEGLQGRLGGCVQERAGQWIVGEVCSYRWPSRPGEPQHGWEAPRLAVSARQLLQRSWEEGYGRAEHSDCCAGVAHASCGQGQRGQTRGQDTGDKEHGQPEPSLGQPAHGLSRRLDGFRRRSALKALGNAVVPQVVEVIGRAIMEAP